MVHPVKEGLQVQIHHPVTAFPGTVLSVSDPLMSRASRSEAIAVWVEARFPVLLDNLGNRLLDEAIQHCRYAQWAGTAIGFGNGDPPYRLWSVGLLEQLLPDLWPVLA